MEDKLTISSFERDLIINEAGFAESEGRLTSKQLEIIYRHKWFHLLVPKAINGAELSVPEFARFVEMLASIDGSFAWCVNLGAGANMFSGFMNQAIAGKLFTDSTTCVAGSGAVSGTAKGQNGGFIINGYWKYASGSGHANYFSLNARLINGGDGAFASFLVPAKDVQVLQTWDVFGMKATSSCDFRVSEVWVPQEYLFDLQKPSPTVDSPLYRFPFQLLAEINMLVMVSGLAQNFVKLIHSYTTEKATKKDGSSLMVSDHPSFIDTLNTLLPRFTENRTTVFKLLDEIWEKIVHNEELSIELSAAFSSGILKTADSARKLVDGLYPFTGMAVLFEGNEMSRVYRDFKVASQHALLSPLNFT